MFETVYKCKFCFCSYLHLDNLKKHVRQKHNYNCLECKKVILYWDYYIDHAKDCKWSRQDLLYHYLNLEK